MNRPSTEPNSVSNRLTSSPVGQAMPDVENLHPRRSIVQPATVVENHHAVSDATRPRATIRLRRMIAVVCTVSLLATSARAETPQLPLTAPVKKIGVSTTQQEPPQAMQTPQAPPRPRPSTPAGKLPQYQLDHSHRFAADLAKPDDARVRLILALPTQSLLIEAAVTIDGQPFRMARENRIKQIVEQVRNPAPEPADNKAAAAPKEASVPETDANTQTGDEKDEQPDAAQPSTPPYDLPEDADAHVRRYLQATGEAPDAEQVRWLLTQWIEGPTLLLLNENFQRFRGDQRPLFQVLDRDSDGILSTPELAAAVEAVQKCDQNRDDIIEYAEIAKVADGRLAGDAQLADLCELIGPLPMSAEEVQPYRAGRRINVPLDSSVSARFDRNQDGYLDAEELDRIREISPDLSFTIAFASTESNSSRIELAAAAPDVAGKMTAAAVVGTEIRLTVGGTPIHFSAVQAAESDQLSVGLVNDGYPLLPEVDPNEDGRLTIRELRQLTGRLREFDRNGDGNLTAEESPSTVRICFGLGPIVHRELADMRRVRQASDEKSITGPEWFVRMDRNRDNDLTREEFPGTDEQFAALDADGDQLISAQEAADFDSKSSAPAPETTKPDTQSSQGQETGS